MEKSKLMRPLKVEKSEVAAYTGYDINVNLPNNKTWVASVHSHKQSKDEAKEYALLFAAAPDLLNALEELLDSLPSRDGSCLPFHYKRPLMLANEAIKKAKGEI